MGLWKPTPVVLHLEGGARGGKSGEMRCSILVKGWVIIAGSRTSDSPWVLQSFAVPPAGEIELRLGDIVNEIAE